MLITIMICNILGVLILFGIAGTALDIKKGIDVIINAKINELKVFGAKDDPRA